MMALGGMFAVLGSKFIGYPSAGALGCITIAFVAGIGWRRRAAQLAAKLPAGGQQQQQRASVEYVSRCAATMRAERDFMHASGSVFLK